METFIRFFFEFISIFFEGISILFGGIVSGFKKMFNINDYSKIIGDYKDHFNSLEWILFIISIIVLIVIVLLILFLIFLSIKKLFRRSTTKMSKEELLEEISHLNDQVAKLMKEKDELMAMKVSQLGINPDSKNQEGTSADSEKENEDKSIEGIRFPKLALIDEKCEKLRPRVYDNNYTLDGLIDDFRCFAASQLGLYYDVELLRPFFAGLACGKLIILQGISGTGKTSLAYAWGKFVKKDSCVSSVEPSWRDKSDFLGYFNELTKKFNETKSLGEIYESGYDDDIHTIILDEMNLARVEYYFADLLSILEMPNTDEWLVDIVPSAWPNDPKHIVNGKLKLPPNLWYIGTINNDESTFMVTDKVYDRAMPIDIDTKVEPFKCREQEAIEINSSYLQSLFKDAESKYKLSDKGLEQVKQLDDYIISHFRIAFGNRIMKQLRIFVSIYVACGGKEIEAIDYFIAKKVLRKFDSLSITFIRNELDPFISYLNKTFGKGVMKEMLAYVEKTKKNI
jgi:hypothetical protein